MISYNVTFFLYVYKKNMVYNIIFNSRFTSLVEEINIFRKENVRLFAMFSNDQSGLIIQLPGDFIYITIARYKMNSLDLPPNWHYFHLSHIRIFSILFFILLFSFTLWGNLSWTFPVKTLLYDTQRDWSAGEAIYYKGYFSQSRCVKGVSCPIQKGLRTRLLILWTWRSCLRPQPYVTVCIYVCMYVWGCASVWRKDAEKDRQDRQIE